MTSCEESLSCPFSVEMIAEESDDGSASGSVHLEIPETTSTVSKTMDEDSSGPELVRVESSEDSASTSSEEKGSINSDLHKGLQFQNDEVEIAPTAPPTSTALIVANDDQGMIDCLSDQFTNMFCPVREHQVCAPKSETIVKEPSCDIPCIAFSRADPSTDVFSQLQFWWSPSQEEKEPLKRPPQNRSIRHKSKHIRSLIDSWHPTPAEPLIRSKSILDCPEPPKPTIVSSMPDGYYDSDPEEVHKSSERRESLHSRTRSMSCIPEARPSPLHTKEGFFDNESDKAQPLAPKNADRKSFQFSSRDQSPTSLPKFDLLHPSHDDSIRQFVQEVTNTKLNLIWHRHSCPEVGNDDDCIRAPLAVGATFEVGTHLDQKVVQPKLSWTAINKKNGQKKLTQSKSDWIELLSIIRVIAPKRLNRKLYPFARTDRTLCIIANDERNPYLVFEAEDSAQRDWLVMALKMTVARLASIIIVKDESMLMEFFSPYAALMTLKDHEESEEQKSDEKNESIGESLSDSIAEAEADEGVRKLELDSNGELNLIKHEPVLFNPKTDL